MPIILHLDFNSYFASVEQQANPFLRGKPIAVAGKGKGVTLARTVVTTASREAKHLGIKTAMASTEALRILPELIMIEGDPQKYSTITKRFLDILRRYSDAMEQFSTDEAFADLTYAAGDYFGATMMAQMIRDDICKEIGEACTVSIGIAPNKLAAKLASESCKPNGLTVITPKELIPFIDAQPLQAICGIGPRIAKRLEGMGILSLKALRSVPLAHLVAEFKSYGHFLYRASRGLGSDSVSSTEEAPKSIGHSYTFPHDLDTEAELQTNLLALCDKVAARMRRDGFAATEISVYARYSEFGGRGMQKRFQELLTDGLDVYKIAWSMLEKIRDTHRGIRLLGVTASGLFETRGSIGLLPKTKKMNNTLRALDHLQERYGSGIWGRASTMKTHFKERVSGWHYDHEL